MRKICSTVHILLISALSAPCAAQTYNPDFYRLKPSQIECLKQYKSQISSLTQEIIILDASVCPPKGVDLQRLANIQDNAMATGKMASPDPKLSFDSIVIMKRSKIQCYFLKLDDTKPNKNDEPEDINFSSCEG